MTHLDLLVPPPEVEYHFEAAEQARDYVAAFARAGIAARPRPWPEAGDAPALALLAWGYHLRAAEWDALLGGWRADIPLFNPPALMRWNTRKIYLAELEAAGVPVVPTWYGDADGASVVAAFDRFATDTLVVKPQVSAGSHRTHRLRRGEPVPEQRDAMVQPFLPAIGQEGECSLFYVGGALTHGVRKQPAGGDFRIQPQFGGTNSRWTPDDEARAVAAATLAAVPGDPVYARVDLVRRADGRLALIEFEAIEPDLYVEHGEGVLDTLAAAVKARL